jgi:proliferating cell nuclear antigen PCNA
MFKATFLDIVLLKKTLEVLNFKDFLQFATLYIEHDGIHIQSMDSERVSMMDIKLSKDYMSEFETSRPIALSIDLENLCKIFKCSVSNGTCKMNFKEEKPDILTIQFYILNKKKSEFKLKLLKRDSLDEQPLTMSETKYKSVLNISNIQEFNKLCNDFLSLEDTLKITYEKATTSLELSNSSMSVKNNLSEQDIMSFTRGFTIDSDTSVNISLKYFSWCLKLSLFTNTANLYIDNVLPIFFIANDQFVETRFMLSIKTF